MEHLTILLILLCIILLVLTISQLKMIDELSEKLNGKTEENANLRQHLTNEAKWSSELMEENITLLNHLSKYLSYKEEE